MTWRRSSRAAFAALLLSIGGAGMVDAASPTSAAKDDGKAFGSGLRPSAATAAKTAPTAATIPNYTASPTEQSYYGDPSTLAPAATAAAPGSTGYQSVTQSMTSRATFPKVDLDATVARGKTVASDPTAYTSGFAAAGAPGSCVPLPPGGPSGSTYEATCNAGYTGGATSSGSCSITLTHQFSTVNRYECSAFDAGRNGTDDCSLYDAAETAGQCERVGSRPGACLQMGRYGCVEPGEPIALLQCSVTVPGGRLLGTSTAYVGSTPDETSCAPWRSNPDCVAEADVCTDSTPTTRVISGVSVTKPCWAWSRGYTCTAPLVAQSDCSNLEGLGCVFEREECITGEDPCLTVDRVYKCPLPAPPADKTQYICDGDVYCLNGECDTIDRTPNTEFKDAAVALNAASQAGKEFDPNNLTLFKGSRATCGKAIFGFYNCCVPRGFPVLASCSAAEKQLAKSQDKGLCTLVGTYCSNKVLGVCTEKKEAHCCFLSKISRILQEQGRPQIGKPWDSPKNEKCLGFTIEEFQRLDLSKMDFSEVYAEFTDAAKLPDELATTTELQTKINDYFAANH